MKRNESKNESGAALIAVLFISILLVTASAFLLSAVGNNSRNTTDILAETKAYYAAESGLQAAINVFRNNTDSNFVDNPYSYAVNDPDLDTKLTGYTTVNGIRQIPVGTNSGYSLQISDPDNSGVSTTFSTDGEFLQADGYTYASSRIFGSGADTTTISYVGASATPVHPMTNGVNFGHFQIVNAGAGASSLTNLRFRVNYRMTSPRAATRSLHGTITGSTREVEFNATDVDADTDIDYVFSLMGVNNLSLCPTQACTSTERFTFALPVPTTTPQSSSTLWGKMLPIEPYRLKLLVTGYARPGNAKKQLEAVIQRNFFNGLGSSSAISMLGPNAYFNVGTSAQMNIDGGSNTSITVTDPAGLNNVNTELLGPPDRTANVTPAPQIAGPDLPYWQQSPQAMHAFVTQLKQAAQNSGRYFDGTQPANFGNFAAGTGITFCNGSCAMSGNSEGGGILVVTGTFSTSGNPRFNGLVLAVGQYVDDTNPGGVVRSGGGNEIFTGNIVIAPYNPNNLLAGWGQPRYDQGGGPGDTVNSDVAVDQAFDGTTAITDFVLGIAEK